MVGEGEGVETVERVEAEFLTYLVARVRGAPGGGRPDREEKLWLCPVDTCWPAPERPA